jgi:hypothetical protein
MTFYPLHEGVPFEDVIILGSSATVVESSTARAAESAVATHDLTSGGTWRLETTIVTPTSTGDYTSLHPVEKRDMIWEKELVPGRGTVLTLITSVFNTTTSITRTGGLPVKVSEDRFKITYILSDWVNHNSNVNYVTLIMSTNTLTNQDPDVTIHYPTETTEPFVYGSGVPGRWQFNMSLDRWTIINGAMDYVGELIPAFTSGDDYYTRNEVNVSLIYATAGLTILEYDPTGLFALFDTQEPTNGPEGKKKAPLWVIGLVLGILAVATIVLILILKVPALRSAVLPHEARAKERVKTKETKRQSTWTPSSTPQPAV